MVCRSNDLFLNTIPTAMRKEDGLSLVEVLLALVVLLLVLPLVFTLFTYTSSAFETGRSQMDIQQNLRMIANYVEDELRYSDRLEIVPPDQVENELANKEPGYDYLWIDEGQVVHEQFDSETEWTSRRLFSEIGALVDIQFEFSGDEILPDDDVLILPLLIKGERLDGRKVDLSAKIRLLNIEMEMKDTWPTGNGPAIKYQRPAPAPPSLRVIKFFHPESDSMEAQTGHGHGKVKTVDVLVETENVTDGLDAKVYLDVFGPEGEESLGLRTPATVDLNDNQAQFELNYGDYTDYPAGTYEIRARIDVDGTTASLSRLYKVRPLLTKVDIYDADDEENGTDLLPEAEDEEGLELEGQSWVVSLDNDIESITIELQPLDSDYDRIEFNGEPGGWVETLNVEDLINDTGELGNVDIEVYAGDGVTANAYTIEFNRKD